MKIDEIIEAIHATRVNITLHARREAENDLLVLDDIFHSTQTGEIIGVCIHKLMRSDYREPINLGQDRLLAINQLADIIADIAGVRISKKHVPGPQGVRGRNSDNTLLRQVLGWEPEISLEEGLRRTYAWVENQVRARLESIPDAV